MRLRQKNVVSLHKKHIQKGAKVKDGPERVGSVGINEGDVVEMWDRRKTLKENCDGRLLGWLDLAVRKGVCLGTRSGAGAASCG